MPDPSGKPRIAIYGMGQFGQFIARLAAEKGWPIVAAFIMTQWDLVMDPPLATISKAWIWHDGGAHFGVPFSNYLGWLLTSWLFYQAFAIYLGRRRPVSSFAAGHGRALRLVAILLLSLIHI